ncbi:hypothetical protein D3C71_1239130 [compost metagenome]
MTIHHLTARAVRQGDDLERPERAAVKDVGGQGLNACFVFVIQVAKVETLFHAGIGIADFHCIGAFDRAVLDHCLERCG